MKICLILSVVTIIMSCNQHTANIAIERESIMNCWRDWDLKSKAGDPAFYWSDDVVLMSPGSPTIKGKQAFLEMYQQMQKMPGFKIVWDSLPTNLDFSPDGNMAYLMAKNKFFMQDSTGLTKSINHQVVQIWKKDPEGNWKAAVSVMYPENNP